MARLSAVQLDPLRTIVGSIKQAPLVRALHNALETHAHGLSRQRLILRAQKKQLLAKMSVAMVPARELYEAIAVGGVSASLRTSVMHVVELLHIVVGAARITLE